MHPARWQQGKNKKNRPKVRWFEVARTRKGEAEKHVELIKPCGGPADHSLQRET